MSDVLLLLNEKKRKSWGEKKIAWKAVGMESMDSTCFYALSHNDRVLFVVTKFVWEREREWKKTNPNVNDEFSILCEKEEPISWNLLYKKIIIVNFHKI